jgi:hypothetical protein
LSLATTSSAAARVRPNCMSAPTSISKLGGAVKTSGYARRSRRSATRRWRPAGRARDRSSDRRRRPRDLEIRNRRTAARRQSRRSRTTYEPLEREGSLPREYGMAGRCPAFRTPPDGLLSVAEDDEKDCDEDADDDSGAAARRTARRRPCDPSEPRARCDSGEATETTHSVLQVVKGTRIRCWVPFCSNCPRCPAFGFGRLWHEAAVARVSGFLPDSSEERQCREHRGTAAL